MKRYFTIVLYIILLTPFVSYAQRNNNKTKQEETIIWRTGTYPSFTENKITPIQQKEKLDSLVNNSEYIVEGYTTLILTFTDPKMNVWHVCQLNIRHKIKGDIQGDTIYFLWQDNTLYFDPNDPSHDFYKERHYTQIPSYNYFDNGIFFLKKNTMPIEKIKPNPLISPYNLYSYYDESFSATKNISKLYEPVDLVQWGINYGEAVFFYGPYWMKIKRNCWDLYEYLEDNYKLKVSGYDKKKMNENVVDSSQNSSTINNTNENEENFINWIKGGRKYKKDLLQKPASKTL